MNSITKDDVLNLISTERRRLAIEYLDDSDGFVTLSDMAEWVAARENECSVHELTSTQRKRTYIPLYQNHLPKLEEQEVVTVESKSPHVIRRGPAYRAVRDALVAVDRSLSAGNSSGLARLRSVIGGEA